MMQAGALTQPQQWQLRNDSSIKISTSEDGKMRRFSSDS